MGNTKDHKSELPVKDIYSDRIPLEKCKEILCAEEYEYSNEDVILIRDFLYNLGAVDYYINEVQNKKEAKMNNTIKE